MRRAISGQYLFFTLVSALSGNPVAGSSGYISGRKATDGISGMILLSGYIIELGGGSYRANLYDFDTSGLQIGYLFTASGCVPVSMHVDTVDQVSGNIYPASGVFAVATATLGSGVLSGQLVDVLINNDKSGYTIGTNLDKSGYTAGSISGTTYLASGSRVNVYSGQLSGQLVNIQTNNDKSGYTVGVNLDKSGYTVGSNLDKSGYTVGTNLDKSGYTADSISGTTYLASGSVSVTATVASGSVYLASGHMGFYSGNIYPASGVFVVATAIIGSGALSGQVVDVLINNDKSGYTVGVNLDKSGYVVGTNLDKSGYTVGVNLDKSGYTAGSISGTTYLASGSVSVTATVASGSVYLASGHQVVLYSGQSVLVNSGQLSGQLVNIQTNNDKSGYTVGVNLDKSGYTASVLSGTVYPASGMLDQVVPQKVLTYLYSSLPDVSGQRNLANATRKLINKWDFASSGYLTVYQENDTTIAYRQSVGTASGAPPVNSLDTV